jgi:predicted nucleotidyltransferase component of viral defense system
VEILPYALNDARMALKGGTAINLFHRNFPRLSVDIDLCYLPLEDRDTSYKNIHQVLADIKKSLESKLDLKVSVSHPLNGKNEAKLVAKKGDVEVKIEPNYVLRSSLFPAEVKQMAPLAVNEFEKSVKVKCLNIADTYGGKICAALDRQHPRDLFDVKYLFENEGITDDVKDSFIYYLISHNRPIDELLNPNLKDIAGAFKNEFIEMSMKDVSIQELIKCRLKLIKEIRLSLTENDKKFILSFAQNNPNWDLVRDSKIQNYPSVKWKLFNQKKMEAAKVSDYLSKIDKLFN